MKRKASTLLLLFLPWMVLACSGAPDHRSGGPSQVPEWYLTPPRDGSNLYGTGEGFTVDEATAQALNQIASRIFVTISSEFSRRMEQDVDNTGSRFSSHSLQDIDVDVDEVEFTSHTLVRSERAGDRFYVLVEVDRFAQVERLEAEIKEDLSKAEALTALYSREEHLILKARAAGRSNRILKDLRRKALIRDALEGFFMDTYAEVTERISRNRVNLDQALSSLSITLRGEDGTDEIVALLGARLNREGIVILEDLCLTINDCAQIFVTVSERENLDGSTVKMILDYRIATTGVGGGMMAQNNLTVSGISFGGSEAARIKAMENVKDVIEKQELAQLLGLF
ncbi:hypothetical protein EP232_03465 [bacterium]|nr:MAG: hypothetical protein EP232_03465 [bacterium]